jgi:hypothetical protein
MSRSIEDITLTTGHTRDSPRVRCLRTWSTSWSTSSTDWRRPKLAELDIVGAREGKCLTRAIFKTGLPRPDTGDRRQESVGAKVWRAICDGVTIPLNSISPHSDLERRLHIYTSSTAICLTMITVPRLRRDRRRCRTYPACHHCHGTRAPPGKSRVTPLVLPQK